MVVVAFAVKVSWDRCGASQMGVYYSHYLIPENNTIRPDPSRIVALIEAWTEKGFVLPANSQSAKAAARYRTPPPPEQMVEREQPVVAQTGFWARLLGKKAPTLPRPDPWKPFLVPPTGDSLSALAEPYVLIRWEGNSNAVYPMRTVTENISRGDHCFPHHLMIELSDDYLNIDSAPYGSAEGDVRQVNPICACGRDLGYDDDQAGCSTPHKIRRVCPSCGAAFRPQDQVAEIVDGITGTKMPQPGGLCNRFAIIIEFGKEMPLDVADEKGDLVDSAAKVTDVFLETCISALGVKLNEFSYYS
jgi:hypothetical protein